MEDKLYIRSSSIYTWVSCPEKFYFQNIEKIQVPNKPYLAFGTSIHKSLEYNFSQKLNTKIDLALDEIKQHFSETIDKEFENVEENLEIEDKNKGIKLIELYAKNFLPKIQPLFVEKKIMVDFENFNIGLSGTIDLIDVDYVLIDYKTTNKYIEKLSEAYKIQVAGAYPFLMEALTNIEPRYIRIDFFVKEKLPYIKSVAINEEKKYFYSIFSNVNKSVEAGLFMPRRDTFLCSRKLCPYWDICEKKNGGTVKY